MARKMRKKTKEKIKALSKYIVGWIAALFMVFVCVAMVFAYIYPCPLCLARTYYVFGLLAGVTGTTAYFMLYSLFTPIVKWIWWRVKRKPQGFIELIKKAK